MSPKKIVLKEGAYLISDAHYSELRPELLTLIEQIHSKDIVVKQLILMGDIFDALFGDVPYTEKKNRKMIRLLNEISREIEVVYLEGNHDFNLTHYFPYMKIFPMKMQPVQCVYEEKNIYLAHGDFDGDWSYKLYCRFIRNRAVVKLLVLIDKFLQHKILKKLDAYLAKKDDCNEFSNFKQYVSTRLEYKFQCDYFIEGHYHQNKHFIFENFEYINLAAFACNQRYFIVKSLEDRELLEEKRLS